MYASGQEPQPNT